MAKDKKLDGEDKAFIFKIILMIFKMFSKKNKKKK